MSHTLIILAKIDFVSHYFRLLWYHSILKGSIDQKNTIKQTKFEDKTAKSTDLLLGLISLHDFKISPDRKAWFSYATELPAT